METLGLLGSTKLKCTMNEEHVHCTLTHVEAGPLLPLLADDGHLDGVGPLVVARLRHADALKSFYTHAASTKR